MINFPWWIMIPAEAFIALPNWMYIVILCSVAALVGWLMSP